MYDEKKSNPGNNWSDFIGCSKQTMLLRRSFEKYFHFWVTKVPFLKSCLHVVSFVPGTDCAVRIHGGGKQMVVAVAVAPAPLTETAAWSTNLLSWWQGEGRLLRNHQDKSNARLLLGTRASRPFYLKSELGCQQKDFVNGVLPTKR